MNQGRQLGHVHLKVSNLERSEAFYRDVLGFEVSMRYGTTIVFMSFGDNYHHHLALNSGPSEGQPPPPSQAPGMLHFAILYPTASELAQAARKVLDSGVEVFAASDHGNSLGLYLRDPDELEVELTWDRLVEEWPRDAGGSLVAGVQPLDLNVFLDEMNA